MYTIRATRILKLFYCWRKNS